MRRVFILYNNFLTKDGKKFAIGGVETYIRVLADVIKNNNMSPIIIQHSSKRFRKKIDGIDIIGVEIRENSPIRKKNKLLFNKCVKICNLEKDIIIFGSHSMGVKNKLNNVIGIQHGIAFDIRNYDNLNSVSGIKASIQRVIKGYNTIIKAKRFNRLVAVDYNFLNWFRTMPGFKRNYIKVIPNFVRCENIKKTLNSSGNIRIIFARRFEKHRGTRLFSNVVIDILSKYKNVNVTFAGNGSDGVYLKEKFSNVGQVKFIEYNSKESVDIHKDYDIAVIPTIGSEGTSLSLLEAMAAKCSVVATNVGGMTNIVLDNFNGLLVDPEENEVYMAIEKLIIDKELRNRLSDNAYKSVVEGFNYDNWERKWIEVLDDIIMSK